MKLLMMRIFKPDSRNCNCMSCGHSHVKDNTLICLLAKDTTYTPLLTIETNHLYCGHFDNVLTWKKL